MMGSDAFKGELQKSDAQGAISYIAYMMIGSYFSKAKAISPWRERTLSIQYGMMGATEQYELEEECDEYFQEKVEPNLPPSFLAKETRVRWINEKNGRGSTVVFAGEQAELWVRVKHVGKGNPIQIDHKFYRRKETWHA